MRRAARADEDQPLRTRLQRATAHNGRTPKRRAFLALAVATLLGMLPIGVRAGDADRPDLLYRRVFIIGDRDAIKSDPDGRKSVTAYTYDVSVDAAKELVVSDPRLDLPPPCGGKIARLFLDRLLARFNVLAVSDCRMGPSAVHCPSEYLPSYLRNTRKIFLELDYAPLRRPSSLSSTSSSASWAGRRRRPRWMKPIAIGTMSFIASCRSR
jgi:hypothetical protein